MMMRNTLAAAIAALLSAPAVFVGSISSAATLTPEITESTAATSVPAQAFTCGAAEKTAVAGKPTAASVKITLAGNDPTQTYTAGSKFTVKLSVVSKIADVLAWQISDYTGAVHASGSVSVSEGSTTATLSCSSTLAGYFAVSAKLDTSGVTQPELGSRPAGFAAFGVLPNVSDYVPEFSASLDTRRFGLDGTNNVEAGTGLQPTNENLGTTWVMSSRSQSLTEPLRVGQYNPATYPIDDSFKQGTLARAIDLHGLPLWASTAPSADAFGSYPPKSFSAFQSYTALVGEESARIHKDYIPNQLKNYYQVTWEPDPGPSTEWMGTEAQMVELYESVWKGVHSTDPDAAVMGPATQSLNGCAKWLTEYAPLGLTKYLDAVSCHGYYTIGASSALPPEPAGLPAKVQALRSTIVSLMPAGTQLFVTETGVSYPMGSHYTADFPTRTVLEEHAEAVVRTHLIMLGEGIDTSFIFYSADFTQHVGFGTYFNLGMATSAASGDIEPKPAAMAIAAATRLVDGSRSLGALTNLPAGAYGYSFLLADKTHVMTALWAHNATFNASQTYELQVESAGLSGTTVQFSAMGNPKSVAYSNGLAKVTLTEMPIYVLSSNVASSKSHLRAIQGYSTGL